MGLSSRRLPEGRAQTGWEPNAGATAVAELPSSGNGLGRASAPPKEGKEARGWGRGRGQAADPAGCRAPLVDVPGHGALSRKLLHPGELARLPLPGAILTRATALGLGPHSGLRVSHQQQFAPRVAAMQGRGLGGGGRLQPHRQAVGPMVPAPWVGLAGSLSQTALVGIALLAADLLAAPSPSLVGPRADEAAALGARERPGTMLGMETLRAPWDRWACVSEGARGLRRGCGWVAGAAPPPSVQPGWSELARAPLGLVCR